MRYLKIFMLCLIASVAVSCSDDELSSTSIFDTNPVERNDLDQWLFDNFTKPYNIEVTYKYDDKETNNNYNVVPVEKAKAKAMAIMLQHAWIDAYREVVGDVFFKTNTPRKLLFLGSRMYESDGSEVLGVAEGGLKITLTGINDMDLDNIIIDQKNPFHTRNEKGYDLNYYIFKTMHHEFCHILNQKKEYQKEYKDVSEGKYHATDWVNVADKDAPKEGFVSGYSTKEYNEDFAEMYSIYVSHTPEAWNQILDASLDTLKNEKGGIIYQTDAQGKPVYKKDKDGNLVPKTDSKGDIIYMTDHKGNTVYDADGNPIPEYEQEPATNSEYRDVLLAKLKLVREYFANSWNIDIDKLRDVVLRRSQEIYTLNLGQ